MAACAAVTRIGVQPLSPQAVAMLAAGSGINADAQPHFAPMATWCPGDRPLYGATWDSNVCHDYYYGPGPDGHTQIFEGVMPPRMCGPVPCGLFRSAAETAQ